MSLPTTPTVTIRPNTTPARRAALLAWIERVQACQQGKPE